MATFQNVIDDLERYETVLYRNREAFPAEIKNNVVEDVFAQNSIDTGAFIQAIDYTEVVQAGGFKFVIDTSKDEMVGYEGFLEFDGETRNFVGRKHFEHGIQNSDFGHILDDIANESFIHADI